MPVLEIPIWPRVAAEILLLSTRASVHVGSGILARIRGTNCANDGTLGSIGFDFLDDLSSITFAISTTYKGVDISLAM